MQPTPAPGLIHHLRCCLIVRAMTFTDEVPDSVLDEAARRFSLLSDLTRLKIVRKLHKCGECSVSEIAEEADATLPNVSQHLSRLLAGGIVRRRREGKSVLYSIADPTVQDICDVVCSSVLSRAVTDIG